MTWAWNYIHGFLWDLIFYQWLTLMLLYFQYGWVIAYHSCRWIYWYGCHKDDTGLFILTCKRSPKLICDKRQHNTRSLHKYFLSWNHEYYEGSSTISTSMLLLKINKNRTTFDCVTVEPISFYCVGILHQPIITQTNFYSKKAVTTDSRDINKTRVNYFTDEDQDIFIIIIHINLADAIDSAVCVKVIMRISFL